LLTSQLAAAALQIALIAVSLSDISSSLKKGLKMETPNTPNGFFYSQRCTVPKEWVMYKRTCACVAREAYRLYSQIRQTSKDYPVSGVFLRRLSGSKEACQDEVNVFSIMGIILSVITAGTELEIFTREKDLVPVVDGLAKMLGSEINTGDYLRRHPSIF
jgi:hypothetical protein